MPINSTDRIILIRVKIERAKKHLRDLAAEILALENTTVVIMQNDASVPSQAALPTLPIDVVSIAGDIVHNLRTALDHLAHQLVMAGSPNKTPSRRIEFP